MRFLISTACAAVAMSALAHELSAQPGTNVPVATVRTVGRAAVSLGSVLNLFELERGRVIVNDGAARRVVILDSALANVTVVLDSVSGVSGSYGAVATPMIAYGRDSLLFTDGVSRALLVIDRAGKTHGVMAGPSGPDFRFLAGGFWGADAKGNFVYRVMNVRTSSNPPGERGPGSQQIQQIPDSSTLVRFNVDARRVDTLLQIAQEGRTRMIVAQDLDGKRSMTYEINPLATVDEWTVLADGSLAVVRGSDYHVEIHRAGAPPTVGPKVPFAWRRLSDEDKARFVDSVRTSFDNARRAADARGEDPTREVIRLLRGVSGAIAATMPAPQPSAPRAPNAAPPLPMAITFVDAKTLPDYYPAFRAGSVRADLDNNVWVLPSTTTAANGGGLVYDVIDDRGVLRRRVQLPVGRSIAGFGRNGVVYLMSREANGQWIVERGAYDARDGKGP
ncbi:MAG TPA: hypothetical protein VE869_08405 [Gemmatimonas sp.]|nr:hypothetical protein [Gemmatimonas sp.]